MKYYCLKAAGMFIKIYSNSAPDYIESHGPVSLVKDFLYATKFIHENISREKANELFNKYGLICEAAIIEVKEIE